MRRKVLAFAAMTAAMLLACGATVWAQESTISQGVDSDPYIVVLEESVVNPLGVARAIDQRQPGLEAGFIYTNALEGFSATIPDDSVAEVRANPNVAYVERDRVVTIARRGCLGVSIAWMPTSARQGLVTAEGASRTSTPT
jgi:hypothetical protein